jgi:H+-transporting ATPase
MIALSDPPREDSLFLITVLHVLGVAMVMLTCDAQASAASITRSAGNDKRLNVPGYEQDRVQIDSTTE